MLSLQSRIIAVPPFVRSVVTLRVCSESLANGVLGEIQREVDTVDWQNLRVTELASDESGTSDPGRRNFSTPNCYGNGYFPKTAEEIALNEGMKTLHGSTHFQFCLGMLDNYASMLNPNAVRSTVSVLMSRTPTPQQYHTDGSGSFQQWSRGDYGHCFVAVLSIGRGMQILNLIVDDVARQLQLACFVGPDAVHGGSSTSGFRIHCMTSKVWTPSTLRTTFGKRTRDSGRTGNLILNWSVSRGTQRPSWFTVCTPPFLLVQFKNNSLT
jgi:hypothetical protein